MCNVILDCEREQCVYSYIPAPSIQKPAFNFTPRPQKLRNSEMW